MEYDGVGLEKENNLSRTQIKQEGLSGVGSRVDQDVLGWDKQNELGWVEMGGGTGLSII